MTEFDWMAARADCSLAVIFERLKAQLQDDVETAKGLRKVPVHYTFKIDMNDRRIAVIVEGNKIYDSVLFVLKDTEIEVLDKDGKPIFKATPTLSDDGQCRLKINGREMELWHLRKMALEDFFFREY
jgi:hypothetical protein